MSIKEYIERINAQLNFLNLTTTYDSGNADRPYLAKNLVTLREAINSLDNIPFIENEIRQLKKTRLFDSHSDQEILSFSENSSISTKIDELRLGLTFLLRHFIKQSNYTDDTIHILLPEISNFDELGKISSDLKRSIEIPINDSNTDGSVSIIAAENGSIWLIVSLGTMAAVNLVAAVCWAAAVVRKKNAEAKIFEAHAKTLDLKNEAIETFVSAQKQQISNILTQESEAIASKFYDHNDPETINRLKLSVSTVADLIDRGAKFLPQSDSDSVKNIFPDYNNLNVISSSIKQLNHSEE